MRLKDLPKPGSFGLILFLLLSTIVFVVWNQQPPAPRSAQASKHLFSAGRAMLHVKKIAARPHPMWSAENQKVREYLHRTLRSLGYPVTLQQTKLPMTGLHPRVAMLAGKPVTNLMVRVKGTQSKGLVAIVAHYDSAPSAPGAADDGAAVAAMLETLRILKLGPKPKNDLLFLFTDAEEIGLWGAKLFMREHPWAREIKFVLNFEARGSRGPSLMFETSSNNGKTIAAFAKADHAPRATSLFYEVYRVLRNDTDFTVFKKSGIQGLNFAFIESIRDYHKPTDSPEQLSKASLQDHGEHMLSMVRHLAHVDLSNTKAPNVVYFDVLGRFLVVYGESTSTILALLLVILILVSFGYAWKQGLLRWTRVGLGVLGYLLTAGVVGASVGCIAFKTLQWKGKKLYAFHWDIAHDSLYSIAFLFLSCCLFFLCLHGLSKFIQRLERVFAALFLWSALLLLMVFYVPGAAYLGMWPLLGATISCLFVLKTHDKPEPLHFVSLRLWLLELPTLLLTVPLFYHLPHALTLSLTGVSAMLLVLFGTLLFTTQDVVMGVAS